MSAITLTIQHGDHLFSPPVMDDITVEWERTGSPGKLKFTTVKVDGMDFFEGDAVTLKYGDTNVFMGYVFTKSRDKKQQIEVTCYDQIRYLKNKYSYVFENKRADEIIEAMCKDYNLHIGSFDNTDYKIPSIAEENKSGLDIALSVLEETLLNTGNQFVLYDDFGDLKIKNSANMISETLVMSDTAEDFEYKSSIDDETYNSIVLYYKPKSTSSTSNADTAQAAKIIQIAAAELGNGEYDGGKSKYGVAYGLPTAHWCCMFVWWVFKQAGLSSLFYGGSKVAACTTAMNWFKNKGRFYKSNPQPGDCVFFNWNGGTSTANHIGIVEKVSGSSVICIEGNCSNRVRRMTRKSNIIGYGRPAYTTTSESSSTYNASAGSSSSSSSSSTSTSTSTTSGSEKIQIFTASNKDKINEWGTLRYFESIDKPNIGQSKADQLLKLYCKKTRELKINGVFGDPTVRGGTLIPVKLDIGERVISNYMLVQKVVHNFNNDHHNMDLTLEGWWDD